MTIALAAVLLLLTIIIALVMVRVSDVIQARRQHRHTVRQERVCIQREQFAAEQKLRALTEQALVEMLRIAREEAVKGGGQPW